MDYDEKNRAHVIKLLTQSLPVGLWRGLQDRTRLLYQDTFSEAQSDPVINPSQRLHYLWQRRHFRMEYLLQNEAAQNAVPVTSEMIARNRCYFTLAQSGPVRMTQSYVRTAGALPRPAAFRKQLAKMNEFDMQPGLLLVEEDKPFSAPPEITGIILHSPCGSVFREEHQALGAIGIYFPYRNFSGWAVGLTFAEIIASYDVPVEQTDIVTPKFKPIRKVGGEE